MKVDQRCAGAAVTQSFYQDNLWYLAGAQPGEQRVCEDIYAVLVAEDNNPYDPAAVAVWISGLKVGHLSRENAQRYRPGLLAQQQALGGPIALAGVIVGGGIRSDGLGKLGVFLRHDPQDFGLPPRFIPPAAELRMRTGLSDAFAKKRTTTARHCGGPSAASPSIAMTAPSPKPSRTSTAAPPSTRPNSPNSRTEETALESDWRTRSGPVPP